MRQFSFLLVLVLLAANVDTASGQPARSGKRGKLRLWIKTPLKTQFEVKQFSGWEAMGKGFEYEAELRPKGKPFDPRRLLGLKVTVGLTIDHGVTRYFNGYVLKSHFTDSPSPQKVRYVVHIRPWIALLRRASNLAVFHSASYPQIVRRIFGRYKFARHRFALAQHYPVREFTVQYRETDRNVVDRLVEQVGISYYFEHRADDHVMVLTDSNKKHGSFKNYEGFSLKATDPAHKFMSWTQEHKLTAGRSTLKDYDFRRPRSQKMLITYRDRRITHPFKRLEIYDWPGEYDNPKDGAFVTRLRMEELSASRVKIVGSTPSGGVVVGRVISVEGQTVGGEVSKYLVTYTRLRVSSSYGISCDVNAIPIEVQFRPGRSTSKPMISGPQTAVVIGPPGKKVDTDKYGRVRVRFHWGRPGPRLRDRSAWIRVAQPLPARPDFKGLLVPRGGQEVMVHFREGDPDRPIITGILYRGSRVEPAGWPGTAVQIAPTR
jgi:type VI secretion system secreted protein VgrG